MSQLVKSEFATVQSAVESVLGTAAAAGWRQHGPNPGGIQNFYPQINKVERNPLSINLQDEKGDIVGLTSLPSLVHDANKDLIDYFNEGIFRSATKWPGGTGVGRWQVNATGPASTGTIAVTGVTATEYTVASGGALAAGVLIYARGFTNAANNGLKLVAAAATNVALKAAGLVIEAAPPTGAMVEVVGVQGAAADITITAGLNLGSTALNFTTLGLNVGQWIWIGGGTAAAPGALGFATAADRGFARITAISATQLTLDRRSTTYVADAGAGKTIQIFFGPWLRNVNGLHSDYKEPSYTLELSLPGAAAAGATDFVYGVGSCVNQFVWDSGLENKVVTTTAFVGMDMQDPTTARATGASSGLGPIAYEPLNTVSQERRLRINNASDETGISTDIIDWKLTVMNNVKAQKQQGTLGAARMIFGKFQVRLDVKCVFVQDDVCKAVRDNRTLAFDAAFRNADTAVLWDVPAMTMEAGNPDFQANDAVTLATNTKAFRDNTYSYTLGLSTFPNLPAT